jgi:YVTN family beta-propeller protein
MKNCISGKSTGLTAVVLLALTSIYSCNNDSEMTMGTNTKMEEKLAVANRVSSSVTFIDATTNTVTKTLSIPNSDPMYVVYVPKTDKLYVGDRANKKIHVINPQNQQVETSINVGNGVFHMWADGQGKELWVVNDMDNTISVVNLATNSVTNTISVDMKPHDIFLSQDGTTAYVSVFTNSSTSDKIYKYSTSTYAKTGEKTVGKEPHLFHANNKLYVPCQLGKTYILDGNTLNSHSLKI